MNANIVNATPQIIQLGAKDMSMKPTPPKEIVIPTHLPLIFGFASAGPATKELVDGARLIGLYGEETFDRSKPYFNHGARMAELMSAAGNAMMFTRIIPSDNDTIANFTLYLDVLNDDVDVLKRNDDGSIYYDENGDPEVVETVKGYKLKVIAEFNDDDDEDTPFGIKKSKTGYMKDGDDNSSTMYPIYEQRAAYKGSPYNNVGIAIGLPTNDDLQQAYKEGNLSLPYEFSLYKRADEDSTGVKVASLAGNKSQQFILAREAKDPVTNMRVDLESVMGNWYNLTSPLRDLVYPKVSAPYIYEDNLNLIADKVMEVEASYVNADVETKSGATVNTSAWMDYIPGVAASKQAKISNLFTAMSTKRTPNFTFIIDEDADVTEDNQEQVFLSSTNPIYFKNGKDGTLSEEEFEAGVARWMDKYVDNNSEVIDTAINLESALWDSGFTLPTKEKLVNFISLRKDTFLGLSTRVDNLGDKYEDLITQRAIGLNLKARLGLAPESTFFGTPVTRGIVVVGSGKDSLDPSNRRYGLLHDIAYKTARMMGGKEWKKSLLFDRGERNTIVNYSDIEPASVPNGIKADLWNIGLNWPMPMDRTTYYFPAMQSVYDNDSSSMNNIFMALALTTTVKVADAAGRKFSGNIELSPSQLTEAVENYMNGELKGKFAGVITAVAKASITDYDAARGYSFSVVTKLGGDIMTTVMSHYTEIWNKADM